MNNWNNRFEIFTKQASYYSSNVSVKDFVQSTFCSFKNNYFYASTPKVGCSTIKKILIESEIGHSVKFEDPSHIHFREFNPFLKIQQVGDLKHFFSRKDIFKFCFVRNPYTRILSCYLDKIKRQRPQIYQIKVQLGLNASEPAEISFKDFVHRTL